MEFSGRTVIVTGGSQGIGASIAATFGDAGANTVVHYRSNAAAADEVVGKITDAGGNAVAIEAQLDVESEVDDLFTAADRLFGQVSVLINNAGTYPTSPLVDLSQHEWRTMYANNVESTFLCTKAAARSMKLAGAGVIINIASISAINPGPDHSHYNSAKSAVVMFTRSAAQELGQYNIRVNAVAPGLVDRPNLKNEWPDGVERFLRASPLSCLVEPEDVSNACVFLASDNAARVTGVTIPVDCGVTSARIY